MAQQSREASMGVASRRSRPLEILHRNEEKNRKANVTRNQDSRLARPIRVRRGSQPLYSELRHAPFPWKLFLGGRAGKIATSTARSYRGNPPTVAAIPKPRGERGSETLPAAKRAHGRDPKFSSHSYPTDHPSGGAAGRLGRPQKLLPRAATLGMSIIAAMKKPSASAVSRIP